ncbi:HAMP domain-containing sensor histidine kinase [Mesorhizobium sp. VK24D]|uniref:histidine kinase n=1 Tax=Mesorhizobium album TaxID=3072314 RepID=A0ABU4Y148_9HYPH|nr:HAMP domain-containing sensor histidine kinase [Mesorhizobium sp. VK24D]MDX8480675.1 HAMP domain-containing sensor histidine kinase [Mesorhizobium sp. VK24D]
MKLSRESLRGRLVLSMLIVFGLGLATSRMLRHEGPIREPYQDILVLISSTLCAAALSWIIIAWSLRHLASASREAAIVGPANPSVRISMKRLPEEIRPLVVAVNGALDRLSEAYEMERRFVADAAHELRTPLAVLSLRLQRAKLDQNPDWPAIDSDVSSLHRLVEQLLDLARKDQAQLALPDLSVVNLSRIAREAAASVIPLAEERHREIEVDLPNSLPVQGRADDLRDMVRNLLDNALLHGSGKVRLISELANEPGGPEIWITVSDEGKGVPEHLRDEVFERFRKADTESPGHGLGLAIVREVARTHGGSVGFLPGSPARIRVKLPVVKVEDRSRV